MNKKQIRRTLNFYTDEIGRNKKMLFQTSRIAEMKKIQARIKFLEQARDDLANQIPQKT